MRRSDPTKLEEELMLVLASCGEGARGKEICRGIARLTGRDVSLAAVHITLSRCEEKGWVSIRTVEPKPGAGGNPRKLFGLTRKGASTLEAGREERTRLWAAARVHPFLAG